MRKAALTLADLADASGLPARTIRFYIARGLLNGPAKAGRSAAYTPEHLARLEQIKRLQREGRTLTEIAHRHASGDDRHDIPPPAAWWQHALSDDVVIWTRADASPWRTRQLRAAIARFAQSIEDSENGKGKRNT